MPSHPLSAKQIFLELAKNETLLEEVDNLHLIPDDDCFILAVLFRTTFLVSLGLKKRSEDAIKKLNDLSLKLCASCNDACLRNSVHGENVENPVRSSVSPCTLDEKLTEIKKRNIEKRKNEILVPETQDICIKSPRKALNGRITIPDTVSFDNIDDMNTVSQFNAHEFEDCGTQHADKSISEHNCKNLVEFVQKSGSKCSAHKMEDRQHVTEDLVSKPVSGSKLLCDQFDHAVQLPTEAECHSFQRIQTSDSKFMTEDCLTDGERSEDEMQSPLLLRNVPRKIMVDTGAHSSLMKKNSENFQNNMEIVEDQLEWNTDQQCCTESLSDNILLSSSSESKAQKRVSQFQKSLGMKMLGASNNSTNVLPSSDGVTSSYEIDHESHSTVVAPEISAITPSPNCFQNKKRRRLQNKISSPDKEVQLKNSDSNRSVASKRSLYRKIEITPISSYVKKNFVQTTLTPEHFFNKRREALSGEADALNEVVTNSLRTKQDDDRRHMQLQHPSLRQHIRHDARDRDGNQSVKQNAVLSECDRNEWLSSSQKKADRKKQDLKTVIFRKKATSSVSQDSIRNANKHDSIAEHTGTLKHLPKSDKTSPENQLLDCTDENYPSKSCTGSAGRDKHSTSRPAESILSESQVMDALKMDDSDHDFSASGHIQKRFRTKNSSFVLPQQTSCRKRSYEKTKSSCLITESDERWALSDMETLRSFPISPKRKKVKNSSHKVSDAKPRKQACNDTNQSDASTVKGRQNDENIHVEIAKTLNDSFDVVKRGRDEPLFAHIGPVERQKEKRRQLPGWSCMRCQSFYDRGNYSKEELAALMDRCSKHRSRHRGRVATPNGFWDVEMSDSDEA